jgi:G3E family GTPase
VALPGEILVQFWAPPLDALLGETTVAVVVDVEKVGSGMPDDDTFEEQLSAADVVVLNKCDLADDDALAAAEALLADVTQGQPVIRAVQGRVPSMLLFPTSGAPRRERPASEHHEHDHDVFVTEELRFDGVVSEDDVRARLGDPPPLRAKGFVETIDGLRVVQGVGPRIGFEPPTQAPPPALVGTVVVIRRAS